MSSAAASATAGSVTGKTPRILACVLCQANVQCTPSTPAPARKRRRPNQDLQERLARCEELLKEYAPDGKPDIERLTTKSASFSQSPPKSEEPLPEWNRHGKLIHEDGSVRFVDSYMLSTIYDELRAMRDIIDHDETTPEDETSDYMTPDMNADLLFGGETPQTAGTAVELQPSPGHIFRLWQVFLDRVNPVIKLVHVPSLQPYLVEATAGAPLPKNIEALLFSIYTLAAVSLSDAECTSILGYGRDAALHRFSSGVRSSLMRIGFLKTHDLTTLQALVHYLISLQGRYNMHAAWVLTGVVIRIAQKMGIHRDGTMLGLPPFETEMRRRLWFQILSMEFKTALMSGLGHSLLPRAWDTQEPKNVNDADLHPSATEPVKDRDGPTEMIFVLITNKVARFIVESPGIEPVFLYNDEKVKNLPGAPSIEKIKEFRGMIDGLSKSLLQLTDKYCDPAAGPLHQFTIEFQATIMERIKTSLEPGDATIDTHIDHMFKIAVESFESCLVSYRNSSKVAFLWFLKLQFHNDLFNFLAGQLSQRPSGPLVDRAWDTIENILPYHPELLKVNARKENLLLASLLVKGWNVREEYCSTQMGIKLTTPPYIEHLRSMVPQDYVKSENSSPSQLSRIPQTNHIISGEAASGQLPMPGPMDATFDQFIGNYLDGTDWDVFSRINLENSGFSIVPDTEVDTRGIEPQVNATSSGGVPSACMDHNDVNQTAPQFTMYGIGPQPAWQ
ncbi:uncharacterized protein PgNI_01489 [Pyricularia grisea]|uniref:Xylanolytic transcriptional activator regulatory domain-containing protein n=1 Tax=Pyricularia grisea TaxID=148305 RepID=A0A6P8BFR4_PYRGI|nr:uncharacterized protein PgNI_01489 [Pyricularia grisea]TLD15492.1 hypothetical protein PgNI_01489 [Pyricularia grisea]